MKKPLLSICIPTYNRVEYLRQCLEAIVHQKGFDERVEIVISDNCSTDNTQAVGLHYQEEYENIRYFRNEENVLDKNFPLVFRKATGVFRKLTNDTIMYKPNSIEYILQAVEENITERPQLYFLNSGKMREEKFKALSMEDYIGILGFHITWIASFGIWEEDCDELDMMVEKAYTRLAQVPFLINNFSKHGCSVIYDKCLMDSVTPKNKNLTYGLYEVFYNTFLGFIRPLVNDGKITCECYEKVRRELLMGFFVDWIVNKETNNGQYRFSDEDLQGLVEKEFKEESYFSEYKRKLAKTRIKAKIKSTIKKLIGNKVW